MPCLRTCVGGLLAGSWRRRSCGAARVLHLTIRHSTRLEDFELVLCTDYKMCFCLWFMQAPTALCLTLYSQHVYPSSCLAILVDNAANAFYIKSTVMLIRPHRVEDIVAILSFKRKTNTGRAKKHCFLHRVFKSITILVIYMLKCIDMVRTMRAHYWHVYQLNIPTYKTLFGYQAGVCEHRARAPRLVSKSIRC